MTAIVDAMIAASPISEGGAILVGALLLCTAALLWLTRITPR